MSDYYEKLPSIKITYTKGDNIYGKLTEKIYENAEWLPTGNFVLIYQEAIKTVISLSDIYTIEILKS